MNSNFFAVIFVFICNSTAISQVWVEGYIRKDGTSVRSHSRSYPQGHPSQKDYENRAKLDIIENPLIDNETFRKLLATSEPHLNNNFVDELQKNSTSISDLENILPYMTGQSTFGPLDQQSMPFGEKSIAWNNGIKMDKGEKFILILLGSVFLMTFIPSACFAITPPKPGIPKPTIIVGIFQAFCVALYAVVQIVVIGLVF